ncbi:MAG: 2-dehydropantoate 2-reductase [Hyphomicrobiales bacterium]|nr:2-dehydropantoate 2-reductase [Hyphomicrobiales bacterium]MBV8443563.1 2-dehydropantoate 2-reductase [Hyphomicrobiales bacterium]
MRTLVVGAGAIGGYFGGRLLQAGRDVTFLVRPRRAALLAKQGLSIQSPVGDFRLPAPPTITEDAVQDPFDLVLLSCKAYDLQGAMASFARAVGPRTVILPLLNGMRHVDVLADRFGPNHVLGGLCVISATLDADGVIVHLNDLHSLTFGELDGSRSPRIEGIASTMSGAGFDARLSDAIRQDMWEKWTFIAAVAGITCLMRAAIGDIVAAGASELSAGLLDECAAIAAAEGFPPRRPFLDGVRATLSTPGSPITASMLRDVESGKPVESEAILGDLLRRAANTDRHSLLRIAYAHVKAYEARRKRDEAAAEKTA